MEIDSVTVSIGSHPFGNQWSYIELKLKMVSMRVVGYRQQETLHIPSIYQRAVVKVSKCVLKVRL
jgi:hypothetical protein